MHEYHYTLPPTMPHGSMDYIVLPAHSGTRHQSVDNFVIVASGIVVFVPLYKKIYAQWKWKGLIPQSRKP